ncbi:tyrosine-type recombinase/integrase [Devosia enhydra]|uniref:tyrosine-type recombinase/integrase n=1 Tax=Devosia enhydra TaxID=665118 RepID=UPI001FCD1819|nr:site-specific integrase [Devosia enhydra]
MQIYYYAFKGGPRLPDEYGTTAFIAAFVAATEVRDRKMAAGPEVMLSLLNGYQKSAEFAVLADRTKSDYIKQIKKIEERFRDFPTSAMSDKRTRGIFKSWRDELAKKSLRQADYAFTVLARVLSWSLDRGMIDANPCEKSGRLYRGERSESIWTIDHEAAYWTGAPAHLHLPLLLGLWTGQREGDLLKLRWSDYDGTHIRLRQSKTGKRVTIPVGKPLRLALDSLRAERKPKELDVILLNTRGKPWTGNGFSSSFRKATSHCGIEGLTFHDTRGTAVTRLALAGASVPQIATFTGHSLKDVEAILEVHYLNRDPRMAEDALTKLEARVAVTAS